MTTKLWFKHKEATYKATIPPNCEYISELITLIGKDPFVRAQLQIPKDCGAITLFNYKTETRIDGCLKIKDFIQSEGFVNDCQHPIIVGMLRETDLQLTTGLAGDFDNEPLEYAIVVWNQPNGSKLLSIPSRPIGRLYCRVQQFLQSVCDRFDTNSYEIVNLSSNKFSQGTSCGTSLGSRILPGRYAIVPKSNTVAPYLEVAHKKFRIQPTETITTKSNITEQTIGPAIKRMRLDQQIVPDLIEAAIVNVERGNKFRESILNRDNHCVVTRQYKNLVACHIVARSWWIDTPNRRGALPEEIREVIENLHGNIDNVTNGILLSNNLHHAFYNGEISFYFSGGHYYVAAIDPAFEHLDGIQLDENVRQRFDGTVWSSPENRPNRTLMQFHFRNSVFAHCRGADDSPDESDQDDEEVESAKLMVLDYFGGSPIGEKLARGITSETLAAILEEGKY